MTVKSHFARLSQVVESQRLTGKNMTIAIILVQLVPWVKAGWGLNLVVHTSADAAPGSLRIDDRGAPWLLTPALFLSLRRGPGAAGRRVSPPARPGRQPDGRG